MKLGHSEQIFEPSTLHFNTFASLGVDVNDDHFGCLTFQGAVCHQIGSLIPHEGERPKFAQIYVLDPLEATQRRLSIFTHLNSDMVQSIEEILRVHNPFARKFHRISRFISEGVDLTNVAVKLTLLAGQDPRTHNAPTSSEISVVVPDGSTSNNREIIVYAKRQGLQQIKETSPYFEPLRYPLLFPHGELGWHPELRHTNYVTVRFSESNDA
jgi:hypothetical protein